MSDINIDRDLQWLLTNHQRGLECSSWVICMGRWRVWNRSTIEVQTANNEHKLRNSKRVLIGVSNSEEQWILNSLNLCWNRNLENWDCPLIWEAIVLSSESNSICSIRYSVSQDFSLLIDERKATHPSLPTRNRFIRMARHPVASESDIWDLFLQRV